MLTTHNINHWTFTRELCAEGQKLIDSWDNAIGRVTMYHGEIPGDIQRSASVAAKAYYTHRGQCGKCKVEWWKG